MTNSRIRFSREEFVPLWTALRERIIAHFESMGKIIDPFGKRDFWVVDEDIGVALVQVEIMTLDLLDPPVIYALRDLLQEYPGFAITVSVVPPDGAKWPGMGISLFQGEIIDGLKRSFLPPPYRNLHYLGSRPE
ncbi:MAG: hypothetical protein HZA66_13195 [Rhodopseudomonas palustris]|uniref:Uncharacterized protein n=1 Tax=Rhodopseudomonas palustris TaxID=1076 RepID=A0A933RY90_RHOPL|nr:hypothetical protein [Rhodopseudomonas palustris]